VKQLALEGAGVDHDVDFSSVRVAVIPITSGMGVIGGFSQSVNAIVKRLGMQSYVTAGTDVNGFDQAVNDHVDMIMMADDAKFVAYNVHTAGTTNNSWGTAMGYAVALKNAADGVEGKDVLVIGAGLVGTEAVQILKSWGANVSVTDIKFDKAQALEKRFGIKAYQDVESALASHKYILNAAPAIFPGRLIMEGAVVSTPGVPHYFDEEARRKAKAIIHDPLEIGTAMMAVNSALFSMRQ
jgi:pyrrolysine biosynthesis protein PylD